MIIMGEESSSEEYFQRAQDLLGDAGASFSEFSLPASGALTHV